MYSAKVALDRKGSVNRSVVHGVFGVLLASKISLKRGMPNVTFFADTPALRERAETDLAQALADLDGAQLRLD